ncbi:MAG: cohesin domain-containing protein [Gemmatimonadota bacterium]
MSWSRRLFATRGAAPRALWVSTALLLAVGCGGGDGGDGPAGPGRAAILSAPTFTTFADSLVNVDLRLETDGPAAALQVDVIFPPQVVPVVSGAVASGRAVGLEGVTLQTLSPGRVRVLLFDPAGENAIARGSGPVLTLSFEVARAAPAGTFPVTLEAGLVVDAAGETLDVTLLPGAVTVTP